VNLIGKPGGSVSRLALPLYLIGTHGERIGIAGADRPRLDGLRQAPPGALLELPPGSGKGTGKSGEAKIIATACGPRPVAMLQEIKQGTTTHGSLKDAL